MQEKSTITFKCNPIRLTADFSAETLEYKREWSNVFEALKQSDCQPKILATARLSFRNEGVMKTFQDKQKEGIHDHLIRLTKGKPKGILYPKLKITSFMKV